MDETKRSYQDFFENNPPVLDGKGDSKDIKNLVDDDLRQVNSSAPKQKPEQEQTDTHSGQEEKNEQIVFEQYIPNLYDLSYTCLLIPRFSSHYLMGDLGDRLPVWMKQICISFGWRLEYLSIRPDYFHWILQVPPATSTAYFMRIIRQQTSLQIFEEFPRIKKENMSNDFWAQGYLIYFGSHPHPTEMIRQFIRQTRQQQGSPPNG